MNPGLFCQTFGQLVLGRLITSNSNDDLCFLLVAPTETDVDTSNDAGATPTSIYFMFLSSNLVPRLFVVQKRVSERD